MVNICWVRQFVEVLGVNLLAWFSFDSDLLVDLIIRLIFFGNTPIYIYIFLYIYIYIYIYMSSRPGSISGSPPVGMGVSGSRTGLGIP